MHIFFDEIKKERKKGIYRFRDLATYPRQEIESLFTISRNAKAHRISQHRPDTRGDRYRKIHRTRATPLFYLSARR